MTYIYIAVAVVVGLIVAFFGLQISLIRKMQRRKGTPAPELSGKIGRWVNAGKPSLFYFYSPSCGACRSMTPVVKKLAKERTGGVFPIDISRDMETARRFGVMATPTTIVVGDGIIEQILIGPQPASALERLV